MVVHKCIYTSFKITMKTILPRHFTLLRLFDRAGLDGDYEERARAKKDEAKSQGSKVFALKMHQFIGHIHLLRNSIQKQASKHILFIQTIDADEVYVNRKSGQWFGIGMVFVVFIRPIALRLLSIYHLTAEAMVVDTDKRSSTNFPKS